MKVLVTGGAGYIGGAMVRRLLTDGHEVVILDNLSRGHRETVPTAAKFNQVDILDKASLEKVFADNKFEAVMHFAAFIEAGESMKDPGMFFVNNVIGSQQVIELCVKYKVAKFVFSSTAAVYATSDQPLSETSPVAPVNFYGQTKLMVENLLGWYHQIYGLKYAVLRYFNAAGALPGHGEAHQPESHLIPRVLATVLGKQSELTLFGRDYPTPDGTCVRDYIHIADLVSAHILVLQALTEKPVLTYNLGNGTGYSNSQVIETAQEVTGKLIVVKDLPARSGDAPRLTADASKIRTELGWHPQYPDLKTIIASAWEWAKL